MECWSWKDPVSSLDSAVLFWARAVGLGIGLFFIKETMLTSSNFKSCSHTFSMLILSIGELIGCKLIVSLF